jgi:PEP-CTERM motif
MSRNIVWNKVHWDGDIIGNVRALTTEPTTAVPEPASAFLLGTGLTLFSAYCRRRMRR